MQPTHEPAAEGYHWLINAGVNRVKRLYSMLKFCRHPPYSPVLIRWNMAPGNMALEIAFQAVDCNLAELKVTTPGPIISQRQPDSAGDFLSLI